MLFVLATPSFSQVASDTVKKVNKKSWFENISIRGYAQLRYHGLLQSNENLGCEQCDSYWGGKGGFSVRRARIVVSGDVHPRIFIYFQTDWANIAGAGLHYGQLRDLYADIAIDGKKEFRFRAGLSKVPYGFENMQSSQNRLMFDRSDALNSAVSGERDLGLFFYWAPERIRELFKDLVKNGLKGSGDYGVFGIGAYNGQTLNKVELNNTPHVVARFSWPFAFSNGQVLELGLQGYMGRYVIAPDKRSEGVRVAEDYADRRIAASFILYPKPIGIQAEGNIGVGPRYNTSLDSIETRSLRGGYMLVCARLTPGKFSLIPFYRAQYFDGGKKHEKDARAYHVMEHEMGVEFQINNALELTASYLFSSRRYEDSASENNLQDGRLLRLQLQFNY